MGDAKRCERCGKELKDAGLGGLCPTCLLRQGLAGASASDGDDDAARSEVSVALGPADPGTLARLGEPLGGMPSVLLRDTDPESGPEPILDPASPELPPTSSDCDKFQLFGEIARGGMGAILKARDPALGRELVVKVLLERHKDNPQLVRRFVEEAQIGGQLQHPGIVPVYDLGAFADSRPYFAMKLLKGRTLATVLEVRSTPGDDLPRLLSIFEAVCQTIAYAHARGVIHRDLKPSNVMVGSFGEVQVMDWGLAKVLPRGGAADERRDAPEPALTVVATARSCSDIDASRPGSVMGTPAYMPPEQARGETARIDERADVFALGSILCELLTGQPAYTAETSAEVIRKAAAAELADAEARLAACGADPELIALARSCLAPAVEARPRDARAVAASMTAHLAGVQDRLRAAELARVEAQARAEEERKRRRLTVGLAASVLATVGLGLGGWFWNESRRQATERRFESALADASSRLGVARGSGGDLSAWAAARTAADDLAALAGAASLNADLARRIARLRDEATREATAVAAEAEATRKDRALVDALASARSMRLEVGNEGTVAALRSALADAGFDVVGNGDPTAAVRALATRPEAVRVAAAAGLDEWAFLARAADPKSKSDAWRLPLLLAEALDLEPTRQAVRRTWAADDTAELRRLAVPESVARLQPEAVALLAKALGEAKEDRDLPAAIAVLRRGLLRHPRDVRLNELLGSYLSRQPDGGDAAISHYLVARALQPASGHNLAHLLEARGRVEEAEAIFRELAALRSTPTEHVWNLGCLGKLLGDRGRTDEAETALSEAVAAARAVLQNTPEDVVAHHSLGYVLSLQGKPTEAEAEYRAALRLNPDYPEAHYNLGIILVSQGKAAEAEAEYRTALRSRPDDAAAHNNLGLLLKDQGKPAEAEAGRGGSRVSRRAPPQSRLPQGPLQPRQRIARPEQDGRGGGRVPRRAPRPT
jgi:serine/threonine-protein kinase